MKRNSRIFAAVLLISAVFLGYSIAHAGASSAQIKSINPEDMKKGGILLEVPAEPSTLTESRVLDAARRVKSFEMQQAKAVSARRVVYVDSITGKHQPAWMVSIDGVMVPLRGPGKKYNTQLHLVIGEDGQPIVQFSYQ